MTRMGMPPGFVGMVRLLLEDAAAAVSINGGVSASFPIRRGVRQGCPLAPYLFLFAAEALATATSHGTAQGTLRGIRLPDGHTQQVLTQYADDATFSVYGTEQYLRAASDLLHNFRLASGLVLNRGKCAIYWYSRPPPPPWLSSFGCSIAPPQALSKLLGTPFGISLNTVDVDEFLAAKVSKKLRYWTTIHLSLAGRAVIVNSVLLSTLWIRASLRNFLWAGTEESSRSRVRWTDCCASKATGGLGIVDPDEALVALMGKWVLKGLEPGISPLHQLLRHRLAGIRPPGPVHWPRSLQYSLLARFSASQGSQLWQRLVQSWRLLSPLVDAVPPQNFEEVQNTHLWWTTHFVGQNFGFTEARASQLAQSGLSCLQDLWEPGSTSLRPWPALCRDFGLLEAERGLIESYHHRVPAEWLALQPGPHDLATPGDWLRVFAGDLLDDPLIIVQASPQFRPLVAHGVTVLHIPVAHETYLLGQQSRRLIPTPAPPNARPPYVGRVRRIRVLTSPRVLNRAQRQYFDTWPPSPV
ncbi:hypothetical protein M758_3G162400 [Ceratodon purpureus]|nr:hypothetical protein M758_3G162400 [Ceratodon purpureus]